MRYKWLRILLLALSSCIMISACNVAVPAEEDSTQTLTVLTIGTADSGGTMYPVGSAIAEAITGSGNNIKINVSASSGSVMNVQDLMTGEIDLGLVSGDIAYAALNGLEDFHEPAEGLRVVAAVYSSVSNWIAPVTTGAIYVHDLTGKRIGVGPQGSTTELSANIAVETLGLTESGATLYNRSFTAGAQEIRNGTLDALHGFAGIPIPGLSELADALPCRILKYTEDELVAILSQNPYYYRATIPAGTYAGQTENISTFGVKCLLCVDVSMSNEQVYLLTKALWESRQELGGLHPSADAMEEPEFMYEQLPIPLHSGALQFYQETRLLNGSKTAS